jgi:Family of unknown function (DUF5362)
MSAEAPITDDVTGRGVAAILQNTQPWVRFCSILGFVSAGGMILVGLAAGTVGLVTGNLETAVMIVVYPLVGVLYVFPSIYLLRYADGIRRFSRSTSQQDLVTALDAQRSFWKFIGVLSLVSMALVVIGLTVAFAFGVAMGLAAQ